MSFFSKKKKKINERAERAQKVFNEIKIQNK